ncbi:hypothetical protein E8E13_001936 [Curvularia kusanoi]|uniref:Uncharacterized protein n=1 Tax=Curvularia kusanoi TaxID=90978 RepID=A0A9P4TDE1_CURKU|nr:hypothetical protein E8E13_001936 [Curvularia kusanoi]
MQTTGKDYYDIPDDELPSANFAARPTSEISDLLDTDGLSTFLAFTSISSEDTSCEDDFDDSSTPTALAAETSSMPQPEMPQTPPATPAVTMTLPSRSKSLRQHLRSVSDVAALVRRSSMRQKSDKAPAGSFTSTDYAPQVPRRAMSARLEKRDVALARHSRHLSSESDLKARRVLGIGETVVEEEGSRRAFAHAASGDSEGIEVELAQTGASFSRKPRVRETLERKQMSRLRMDFVSTSSEEFVDSPQSMLDTPIELYAAHKPVPQPQSQLQSQPQPGRFRPTSAIHGRRGTSTPVSPTTPSPFRVPQPQSNYMLVGNEDLGDVYQTRVYVPGSICLEKHPALLRKDSVATIDAFTGEIESIGRRPSDLLALEEIVVYFDGMGLNEGATDECLDQYWLRTPQQALQETEPDVLEPVPAPLTPRSQRSGHSRATSSTLSRFSFSSSSDASVPQDSPQKRQLIRLRRLLSPALPGFKGMEG